MPHDLVSAFGIATVALMIAGLMFGTKEHNKTAWCCWLVFSPSAVGFALGLAQEPELLIETFGRQLANFGLFLMLLSAAVAFTVCVVVAIRWVWKRSQGKPPVYSTKVIRPLDLDGRSSAELQKDDIPYARIDVGSISTLLHK